MSSFLEICKKYFDSDNLYEILKIDKTASEKEVKKAYHKLSLLVHPDRVGESGKLEATEKFKVLGRIHSILSDKDKRKIYDESGQVDDDSDEVAIRDWCSYWRMLFKEITIEDINNYEKNFKGSEMERDDLRKAYINGKGSMDYIHDHVAFVNCDDEPRILEIVKQLVEKENLPNYACFFNEPKAKKMRRLRKWKKEADEAEQIVQSTNLEKTKKDEKFNSLELMLKQNNEKRVKEMDNFLDSLASKYGGNDTDYKPRKRKASSPKTPKQKNNGKKTKKK